VRLRSPVSPPTPAVTSSSADLVESSLPTDRTAGQGLEPDSSISPQEIQLQPFAGDPLLVAGSALKVGLPRRVVGLVPARRQLDQANCAVPCVYAAAMTHILGYDVRKHMLAAVVDRHGVWIVPLLLCSYTSSRQVPRSRAKSCSSERSASKLTGLAGLDSGRFAGSPVRAAGASGPQTIGRRGDLALKGCRARTGCRAFGLRRLRSAAPDCRARFPWRRRR
jgi:hypothetical protein